VRVEAHGGATGGDLHAILERIRQADPAEPFWTGVKAMTPDADGVEIEWQERRVPRLVPSGPVEVECHLYG
jgi:peptide/nickel transport system ATP-binding protein